jgi:hypothetical protein
MVGSIEAASFIDNRNGVDNAAGFSLTPGTNSYRFLIKSLLPLKMTMADATLILVDRHHVTSRKLSEYILREAGGIYQVHSLLVLRG